MVPEARDDKTLFAKPIVARNVAAAVSMLGTVAFDNDAMLEADEIDDIGSDGNLSPPFRSLQPTIPQKTP